MRCRRFACSIWRVPAFFSFSFLDLPFFTKLIVGENSVIGLTEGKNELVMEGPFAFPW